MNHQQPAAECYRLGANARSHLRESRARPSNATARASPNAICAVVLAVGARFSGACLLVHRRLEMTQSSDCPAKRAESSRPVMATRVTPKRFKGGNRMAAISSLSPRVGNGQHHIARGHHAQIAMAGFARMHEKRPACRWMPTWPQSCGRRGHFCPCPSRPLCHGSCQHGFCTASAKTFTLPRLQTQSTPRASMSSVSAPPVASARWGSKASACGRVVCRMMCRVGCMLGGLRVAARRPSKCPAQRPVMGAIGGSITMRHSSSAGRFHIPRARPRHCL